METQIIDRDILIAEGLLDRAAAQLKTLNIASDNIAIISNTTVGPLYGETLRAALPGSYVLQIPDGEQHKTLDTVRELYTGLLEHRANRETLVIALGGGVVGDIAGFVAATFMRGTHLVQMPTSLLSMVDSSVGGKVGVDLPQGKNLVGAFKRPEAVLIDPLVLRSLPEAERKNGLAEVLKHGLLDDASLLEPAMHAPERATELIRRAIAVKLAVVSQDPFERGIRRHLNLGHTFGHAIEQQSGFQWKHGEAVAVGLLAAALLSERLGLATPPLAKTVESLLTQTGLPTRAPGFGAEALLDAMRTDKKWGAKRRFVLLRGPGEACVVEDVPQAPLIQVLETISAP